MARISGLQKPNKYPDDWLELPSHPRLAICVEYAPILLCGLNSKLASTLDLSTLDPRPSMHICLLDIDGTLLLTGGAGPDRVCPNAGRRLRNP